MEYIFLVLAYVIGSIPFSYIFGKKLKNKDLRKHGSGNLGTTNAFRVLGNAIGILVLVLDITKAGILVLIIKYNPEIFGITMLHPMFYGLASVVGHIFPVWMKFKGGKGVASSFGIIIAYAPWVGLSLIPFFLFITYISKYISLASTSTALSTFIIAFILYFDGMNPYYDLEFLIVVAAASTLIFIKHKQNFIRLLNNNENKTYLFKSKKKI
ncbi:MAG: glycerol-3-phosphate 1-O-acyltransferase PlsY [Candidatus Izemoplasmatales bacterium]|uniref:Glycerol-3-phosphate acyltransferase n=1 Tax=Hujiaoplasma nucleasis TaxID=2725268 RepID=A0A7L6N1Y4_9MOLU|nr:glycerol-3-phosphate 1-O-acyltransferase PlsY [Hujiaoplasma nucleasis]QLY39581.1 glycerol-3-phosphate 1-O-acyltransferase PlsY [Hujiaoplasma nucleasis]